jgi:hypothetical protein
MSARNVKRQIEALFANGDTIEGLVLNPEENQGAMKAESLALGADGSEVLVTATADEINRAADVSSRIVSVDTSTLDVTVADHDGRTIVFNRAAGIAVELPAATGSGARFRFVVGTAFTGDATIAVNADPGTDTMVGLVLGLDGDGVPANAWTVGGTNDTITMDGSASPNMTQGGFAGDMYEIEDIADSLWQVNGFIKQTGTEATPMSAGVP